MKRTCEQCSAEFNVVPAEVKRGGGRFCSRKCWSEWQRGENNPYYKGGKIKLLCSTCGKEFEQYASEYDRPSRVRKFEERFCSKKCSAKGKTTDGDGYILLYMPEHPNCNSIGFIREHRYIIEQHIGRLLTKEEVVHHKDNNKSNNSLDNLELLSVSQHLKNHAEEYRRDCRGIFTRTDKSNTEKTE